MCVMLPYQGVCEVSKAWRKSLYRGGARSCLNLRNDGEHLLVYESKRASGEVSKDRRRREMVERWLRANSGGDCESPEEPREYRMHIFVRQRDATRDDAMWRDMLETRNTAAGSGVDYANVEHKGERRGARVASVSGGVQMWSRMRFSVLDGSIWVGAAGDVDAVQRLWRTSCSMIAFSELHPWFVGGVRGQMKNSRSKRWDWFNVNGGNREADKSRPGELSNEEMGERYRFNHICGRSRARARVLCRIQLEQDESDLHQISKRVSICSREIAGQLRPKTIHILERGRNGDGWPRRGAERSRHYYSVRSEPVMREVVADCRKRDSSVMGGAARDQGAEADADDDVSYARSCGSQRSGRAFRYEDECVATGSRQVRGGVEVWDGAKRVESMKYIRNESTGERARLDDSLCSVNRSVPQLPGYPVLPLNSADGSISGEEYAESRVWGVCGWGVVATARSARSQGSEDGLVSVTSTETYCTLTYSDEYLWRIVIRCCYSGFLLQVNTNNPRNFAMRSFAGRARDNP
ncbi:hypothetical protein Tco_1175033 [Tanacetum coccineum]